MISSTKMQITLLGGASKMDLLMNDLSCHGQFPDLTSFRGATDCLMIIRQIAHRFGHALYCHRNFLHSTVTSTINMHQAVQSLPKDARAALLQWITRHGPFWEDVRRHSPDDYLECNGAVVTDTAVGEAAWCCLNGIERGLISFNPSNWVFSPVSVDLVPDTGRKKSAHVLNHWEPISFEAVLQSAPVPLASWGQLEELAHARYPELTFAPDAFVPLSGYPFVQGAAQRLLFIFNTLARFRSCFDVNGRRTPEGQEIYQNFFTGKKEGGGRGALFSDSSDDEKKKFRRKMRFTHPTDASRTLFCPWHGKVQTPPLRVHFSWPVRASTPLYIVYVGPKITMQ